jgi:hypothetical protein
MYLQPIEIFADLPFNHISPNALEERIDALDYCGDDALRFNQSLKFLLASKDKICYIEDAECEDDGQKNYIAGNLYIHFC